MKRINAIVLISATAMMSLVGSLKTVNAEESLDNVSSLNALLSKYVDENANYTKETKIYLNDAAVEELLINGGFHADVSTLERTTYYKGDALWMSRESGKFSYYGTAYEDGVAVGVTNATADTALVKPENAQVVLSGVGKNSMQEYYIGLEDIVAKDVHNWKYENNVYTTSDEEVIEWFKNFTAPCYLGFNNSDTTNYITLNKATIHRDADYNLILGLYATTDADKFTSEEGLFSKAVIKYRNPNFKEDFSLLNANGKWKYGTIKYHWGDKENFDFTPLTNKNEAGDAWIADGIEVKNGWFNAGNWMAIGYTFDEDVTVNGVANIIGGTNDTRFNIRVGIKDQSGNLYKKPDFYGMDSKFKDIYFNNQTFKAGDTIYFIFQNAAGSVEGAYPNADLNITFTRVDVLGDFRTEFSLDDANGQWKYGTINYEFGDKENFVFTPLTDKNSEAWLGDAIEVKAGWFNAGNWMAIAYTVQETGSVELLMNVDGGTNDTRFNIRVGVKNADGNLYENPTFYEMNSKTFELKRTYNFTAGDTIYFIFENDAGSVEGAYPNAGLNITLYK